MHCTDLSHCRLCCTCPRMPEGRPDHPHCAAEVARLDEPGVMVLLSASELLVLGGGE